MTREKKELLAIVSYLITALCQCLPIRSVPGYLRLLLGTLASVGGHVTKAITAYQSDVSWNTHYRYLQRTAWKGEILGAAAVKVFGECLGSIGGIFYGVIDDTVIERVSRKAPGVATHHLHNRKPNRPSFINGQCLVSLCGAVRLKSGDVAALPFMHKLYKREATGSSDSGEGKATERKDKLSLAASLVGSAADALGETERVLLVDSWYMRERLITTCLERKFDVIGQVRIDTALYEIPTEPTRKRRGRPRKYGNKITLEAVRRSRQWECNEMKLYGNTQKVIFRSSECYAKFLGTRRVRVVWVAILSDEHTSVKDVQPKIILSTDPSLDPLEIIRRYEMRWSIESSFRTLKHVRGFKEAWQQTEETFLRWIHILSSAEFISTVLIALRPDLAESLARRPPWRKKSKVTLGLIREELRELFASLRIDDVWQKERKIFQLPMALLRQTRVITQKAA